MWPVLLDMTKEESMQSLRNLELEAYAHLVSALRAQGPLNPDKRKLLKDTSQVLNIPQDRHKAEVRRAVNDEKLNTIAYHVTGLTESLEDWAQEGRRSVPLIPRLAPQTAYSAIADEAAEAANQTNRQLPHPVCTERKRPPSSQPLVQLVPETPSGKGAPFRVPETPKADETGKKRKLAPVCAETSSLAQHLLGGPPKMGRTQSQQIYRQRATKGAPLLKPQGKMPFGLMANNGPKAAPPPPGAEETIEQIQNEINSYNQKCEVQSNENQAPRSKVTATTKSSPGGLTFKQITAPGPSEMQKTVKVCASKKTLAKPPLGQKLIVVSNAQTIQNSSILQKTLSIPLVKNISVKNFEKFKIVTTTSPQLVTAAAAAAATNNITSLKHKVVTVKTNPTTKKVIPLSLINSKGGIKVLPIGGKIVGKTMTTTTTSPPLYIVNTVTPKSVMTSSSSSSSSTTTTAPVVEEPVETNGKSSVLGDILKASGVTTDDFDAQIEEFRIPNSNHVTSGEEVVVDGVVKGVEEEEEEDDFVVVRECVEASPSVVVKEAEEETSESVTEAETLTVLQSSDITSGCCGGGDDAGN